MDLHTTHRYFIRLFRGFINSLSSHLKCCDWWTNSAFAAARAPALLFHHCGMINFIDSVLLTSGRSRLSPEDVEPLTSHAILLTDCFGSSCYRFANWTGVSTCMFILFEESYRWSYTVDVPVPRAPSPSPPHTKPAVVQQAVATGWQRHLVRGAVTFFASLLPMDTCASHLHSTSNLLKFTPNSTILYVYYARDGSRSIGVFVCRFCL